MVQIIGVILTGYLVGSIPWGFYVGKAVGVDIRKHGSGNIGATNVLRTLGPKLAVPVLLLDLLKGVAAVWIARWTGSGHLVEALAGAAAIAGHTWTFLLAFRGGRGVATGLGVLIALAPLAAAWAGAAFLVVVLGTRYVSLGSIIGALTAIAAIFLTSGVLEFRILITAAALFIIYRHIPNIKRLLAGRESKLGQWAPLGKAKD